MTSGEWDLRALKALEEEEQQEFLALSQKSLFEPPSPPPQVKQINAQHLIHSALKERDRSQQQTATAVPATVAPATCNSTNYMQLQAQQLLKLPTINEHHNHQYLLKNKNKSTDGGNVVGGGGGGKLKFTKVLSLSAHSLTNRFGGGGGSLKKVKRTSCSNSPSHYGSSSPMYTPPPTRRCNTLHHSQPQVRKAFKTLQQLEKQKQERKLEALNKTRTLQRIPGTNKTFWKYGIHSTANSITQQHQQQKLQKRKSITSELESNTSDELGSEETQPIGNMQLLQEERERLKESQNLEANTGEEVDFDDTNTETGSCSVPLASDSIEMMSLMLTAASSAVKTQPSLIAATTNVNPTPPPPPDIAATSVGVVDNSNSVVDFPKYFTLNHHNLSGTSGVGIVDDNEETVAYEAFHNMLSRRKSFSGEKLLRAQTLQRNSSLQHDCEQQPTVKPQQQQPQHKSRNFNNRILLKSSSVEAPLSSYLDFNINSTTIINNPLMTNINKSSNKPTAASAALKTVKSSCLSNKKLLTPAALLTIPYTKTTTNETNQQPHKQDCNQMCSSELHHHYLQQQQQQQLQQQQQHLLHLQNPAYHSQHLQSQHFHHYHHLLDGNELNTSSSLIIDDELEEHIKQCSCSCNHMGYGNSMDYQVSLIYLIYFYLYLTQKIF